MYTERQKMIDRLTKQLCLACALGSLLFGYYIVLLNPYAENIAYYFGWKDKQLAKNVGLLTSAMPLGAIIGCLLQIFILGSTRKRTLMVITDLVTSFSIAVQVLGETTYDKLYYARILQGICVGINSAIIPLQLKEFSPQHLAHETGSYPQLLICSGVLLCFLVNAIQLPWEWAFFLPALICLLRITLLTLYLHFDTPKECLEQSDDAQLKALSRYYGDNNLYNQWLYGYGYGKHSKADIEDAHSAEEKQSLSDEEKDTNVSQSKEKIPSQNIVKEQKQSKQQYQQQQQQQPLSSGVGKRKLVQGLLLAAASQLSGINLVMFYSSQLFGEYKTTLNIALAVIQIAAALASSPFTKHFGLKSVLLGGQLALLTALSIIAALAYLQIKTLMAVALLVYVFLFGLTLGTATWAALPQLLDKTGASLATTIIWVLTMLVGQLVPIMLFYLSLSQVFLIFAVLLASCLAYFSLNLKQFEIGDQIETPKSPFQKEGDVSSKISLDSQGTANDDSDQL